MIVDASAIVAIIRQEPGYQTLIEALGRADGKATHAVSIYEAVLAVARTRGLPIAAALSIVERFLDALGVDVVPLTRATAAEGVAAFSRYGRGRGSKAALNMGDCFSYAVAKASSRAILFVGDDFADTDLASIDR